jgi:hypothetical protein
VTHVIRHRRNEGLARSFTDGVNHALALGADIVVNTDGDNQYRGADIEKLVRPVLENRADMVIGCRPILDHPEFGPVKKALQVVGSWTLRAISRTTVRDAASGFRAFSRETCQRLFIYSRFSYCMESLIQAGNSGLRVSSVDVGVNPSTRPSRLAAGTVQYLWRSAMTSLAMFVLYRPGAFFAVLAAACLSVAFGLGLRFVYLVYLTSLPEVGRTYLPSLILLSVSAVAGFVLVLLAILGELVKSQRRIGEENLYMLRRQQTRALAGSRRSSAAS